MAIRTQIKAIDLVTPKNKTMLISAVWSDLETPLVRVGADFVADAKPVDGFLMVTFGAIYVFKRQQFRPPSVHYKFHVLEIRRILVGDESIQIETEDQQLLLKVVQAYEVVHVLKSVIAQLTWGLDLPKGTAPEFVNITFDSLTPLNQRPQDGLQKRAMLFAHVTGCQDRTSLDSIKYFTSLGDRQRSMIRLGPSFRPLHFAAGAARAIAWEASMDTLLLNKFTTPGYDKFVETVVANSPTLRTLIFANYLIIPAGRLLVNGCDAAALRSVWFFRCKQQFITGYVNMHKSCRAAVTDLNIAQSPMPASIQHRITSPESSMCCESAVYELNMEIVELNI
jgi:hypothetical protein